MKSGGEITWDPASARNTNNSGSSAGKLDDTEIAAGVRTTAGETLDNDTYVWFNGQQYKWADLKAAIQEAQAQHRGPLAAGANLSPDEVRAQIDRLHLSTASGDALHEMENKATQVQTAQRDVQDKQEALARITASSTATRAEKTAAQSSLNAALGTLRTRQQELQELLAQARNQGVSESRLRPFSQLLNEVGRDGGGNGTGSFRAMTSSPSFGPLQSGPAGGAQGGQPARGIGLPGGYTPPGGDPLFSGMQPPSSAAYAQALYTDSFISDGLGQLGQSQREGQKLMLLFFYYARMAESGDLGAMYQFIKFINYVVAKDKARQNIQISSKLIQLQDLSRKSTEALMATDTSDPNKINDFTKALHKAKSEETTIATSQKLLADMLQEFAHVTEALVNSTKFLQEAWGRVLRTATSR